MAAKKKEEDEEVSESIKVMRNLLNNNKEDHYNFEEEINYKVPSSSLLNNVKISGGLEPGVHRFIGCPSGGKTSAALDFMKNFLDNKKLGPRRGLFIRSEGRLSDNMRKRSGVKFVTNLDDWEEGTCYILDSNTFEFVFDTIRELIKNNKEKCKFFMIADSLDMMAKREDLKKAFTEAQTVAAGALLSSVFLKKVSIALAKRGHFLLLISQIRETIKVNQYEKTNPKQGSSSGGHAIEHAAGWVFDFQPRFQDDIIREGGEKTGKPIGHFAKCRIVKSDNETYGQEIRYPIRYGRTNGNSIWKEKEVLDLLEMFELVSRKGDKGAWYYMDENFSKEIQESGFPVEEKFQGIKNVNIWLDENPALVDFLAKKFQDMIQPN